MLKKAAQLKAAQVQSQKPKRPKKKKAKRESKLESGQPKKLVQSEVFISHGQLTSDLDSKAKRGTAALELANAEQESIGLFNFSNDHSLKNECNPAIKTRRRSRRPKNRDNELNHSLFEKTKQSTYDEQRESVETVKSLTNFKRQCLKPKSPIRCYSFETNRPLTGNKNLSCEKLRPPEIPIEFLALDGKIDAEPKPERLKSTVD